MNRSMRSTRRNALKLAAAPMFGRRSRSASLFEPTWESLQKCSCSIDVIASLLPYDRFVAAQTVLSMAQEPGNLGGEFRSTEIARGALEDLRRAQAVAEVRCF